MNPEPQSAVNSPTPAKAKSSVLGMVLIVLLGMALVLGTYATEHRRLSNVSKINSQLASEIASLKTNIQKQLDINNGVAPSSGSVFKAGTVSMANGSVVFTPPKDWVQIPQVWCSGGGTRDSKLLCYDVAAISTADKSFSANISVYQYSTSDGTARQWVENKYFEPLSTSIIPVPSVLDDATVNGNNIFMYTLTEPASANQPTPDYVDVTGVAVHGNDVAVVTARVETNGHYGGETPYDYRQNYLPLLEQLIKSVTFKD